MSTKTTLAVAMAASVLAGGAQAALPLSEQPGASPLLRLDAYGRIQDLDASSDNNLRSKEKFLEFSNTTNILCPNITGCEKISEKPDVP